MNIIGTFAINYFILLCVSLVMFANSIVRFKQHPRISLYTILIISNALLLAVLVTVNEYAKTQNLVVLATIMSALGYAIRPVCIYFFILMSGQITPKNKWFFVSYIFLIINALVYVFAFIPATKEAIFYFSPDSDGLHFHGGLLRFSSHIISALYLLYLLYISFSKINSKHLLHGITILSCSLFVVLAVVIESFFNESGKIELLNTTIAVSTMVYYLYLYIEKIQIDTLTGLFNRETYYHDVQKMEKSIDGVIQFDMNGLKYINDNFGHIEGDKAIATIAKVVVKSASKRSMYVYRLGGDEYIILANNCQEKDIIETVNNFKTNIANTPYHCSIGYAYRENKNTSLEDLTKQAEINMYIDKEEFYKNAQFERRKADKI